MEGYKNFRIAVVSVCAGLLLAGCSEPQEPKQTSPVAVSVVVLEASEIRPSREFVARTAASAKADITPRIEAEIREILLPRARKSARASS